MERICIQGSGRIVGQLVRMESGDEGRVIYYDRVANEFTVRMKDKKYKNKWNPEGLIYCARDEFEIMEG